MHPAESVMWSDALHAGVRTCGAFIPDSPYARLYAALICGVNVPDGVAKRLFVDTGLIHILVVSGAHLIFLERMVLWLPGPVRTAILVLYCWLTDWGAPVVRALVARAARAWTAPRGWSALETEALASVLTLAIFPPWVFSRSFLMSWLCVLALTAPGPRGWMKTWAEGARVYVFLYPYSLAAPLTIGWNCLIAPAVGRIMFPAALLAMLVPCTTPGRRFAVARADVDAGARPALRFGARADSDRLDLVATLGTPRSFALRGEVVATRAGFFIILILGAMKLDSEPRRELIVWNVGQGQWVTIVDLGTCWHFDTGGERAPWASLARTCRDLDNRVTYSHWDSDHVGFANRLSGALPGTCPAGGARRTRARAKEKSARATSRLRGPAAVRKLARCRRPRRQRAQPGELVPARRLIPGDATRAEEKRYVDAFTKLATTRWLVLAHHGSRTSTSTHLLDAMPDLRGAIASARVKRYGHPHAEVRRDLRTHHVPLLSTEDWGNIHVEL